MVVGERGLDQEEESLVCVTLVLFVHNPCSRVKLKDCCNLPSVLSLFRYKLSTLLFPNFSGYHCLDYFPSFLDLGSKTEVWVLSMTGDDTTSLSLDYWESKGYGGSDIDELGKSTIHFSVHPYLYFSIVNDIRMIHSQLVRDHT